MSLVFGGGVDQFVGGGVPATCGARRRRPSPARALLSRATALLGGERPAFASSARLSFARKEQAEALDAFTRTAEAVGLSEDERAVLAGGRPELSRVILALETVGAALQLFPTPAASRSWFRGENLDEPFSGRSPLQLMAADGRLGVEMTLLYLRARLRCGRQA